MAEKPSQHWMMNKGCNKSFKTFWSCLLLLLLWDSQGLHRSLTEWCQTGLQGPIVCHTSRLFTIWQYRIYMDSNWSVLLILLNWKRCISFCNSYQHSVSQVILHNEKCSKIFSKSSKNHILMSRFNEQKN